jgi:hypothetical protein
VAVTVKTTGGAPLALVGVHPVTVSVGEPRPTFRFAFLLDLGPVPPTASLAFDAAATQLHAAFEPLDVQVPQSALSNGNDVVIVELEARRQVRAVKLKSAAERKGIVEDLSTASAQARPAHGHGSIQLFRLDGDNLSDKPTATAALGPGRTAVFGDEFTDARFAIGFDDGALEVADLAFVTLRSFPTAPRIALADAASLEADPFFFHAAGQLAGGDPEASVDGGAALAAALQQFADTAGAPAPRSVAVLVESDAECRFRVTSFALGVKLASETFAYGTIADADLTDGEGLAAAIRAARDPVAAHLRDRVGDGPLAAELTAVLHGGPLYEASRFAGVELGEETARRLEAAPSGGDALAALNRLLLQDAFPAALASPAEKRTLRFPADRVGERSLVVELPAGAQPSLARVTTSESLRGDRPAAPDGVPVSNGGVPRRGLHVGADVWTAAGAVQEAPVSATGIALRLLPLVSRASVRVELQPDRDGRPGGSALARGTLELGPAGAASWATTFFPEPAVLGSGLTWILLRAASGAAVWLGESADAELRLLVLGDDSAPAREAALPGLRPSYRIFSRDRPVASNPAVGLRVGDAVVARGPDGAFDAAAALAAATAGGSGGVTAVPLTFVAAVDGTISVPPPRIEYSAP